jgi:hypothetical protein
MLQSGVVKKVGGGFFKIVHETYRAKNAEDQEEQYQRQIEIILKDHPELKMYSTKSMARMNTHLFYSVSPFNSCANEMKTS